MGEVSHRSTGVALPAKRSTRSASMAAQASARPCSAYCPTFPSNAAGRTRSGTRSAGFAKPISLRSTGSAQHHECRQRSGRALRRHRLQLQPPHQVAEDFIVPPPAYPLRHRTTRDGVKIAILHGHQSNLLVTGPDGYSFGDHWKLGLPLAIIVVLVGAPLIALICPLSRSELVTKRPASGRNG